MKRVYFLAAILFVLVLFVLCRGVVVFMKVNPYVDTKALSYIAPTIKYIDDILDSAKNSSAYSGYNYKYLYLLERGSEFLKDNPIPNDVDFEVGIYLGEYDYNKDNVEDLASELLDKTNSFVYNLNMILNNDKANIAKSPITILENLEQLRHPYTLRIVASLNRMAEGKFYLHPSNFMLKKEGHSFKVDYPEVVNSNEIWLYGYPRIIFYNDDVRFNRDTRMYPREITLHPTYYFHLNQGGEKKLVELSAFNNFGINLDPRNAIFSTTVFENMYSRPFIADLSKRYYLSDENDMYVKTRMYNLVNMLKEIWNKQRGADDYRPIKVIKRLMQAADIVNPIVDENIYREIADITSKNLHKKEIQLLNEYDNVIGVLDNARYAVTYNRMKRTGKVDSLKQIAADIVNEMAETSIAKSSNYAIIKEFQDKYMDTFVSSNELDDTTEIDLKMDNMLRALHKEMIAQTVEEDKVQKYVKYFYDIMVKAGYHRIYLYWIDDDTIGILRDDFTKNIKNIDDFVKSNDLAKFKYVLISEKQIPLETVRYEFFARYNPTPEQEKYFQSIRKALLDDKKNFKIRTYFRFGF